MTKKNKILLLLILLITHSCIEEYWPEIENFQSSLVVEGMITNMPPPYTIKISLTSSYYIPTYLAYPGCKVWITDEDGMHVDLILFLISFFPAKLKKLNIPGMVANLLFDLVQSDEIVQTLHNLFKGSVEIFFGG